MSVLIKPIITEKATSASELAGRFSFVVNKNSNKVEIKKAIEETYGVTVEAVNTMNYPVKRSTKYTKNGIVNSKLSAYKKAVVQVAEGETIDFYNNI